MKRRLCFLVSALLSVVPASLWSQSTPQALRGARVYPDPGPPIEDGVVVVQNGQILTVGSSSQVKIPKGAEVIDVSSKVIIPGLVDTHSHIGIYARPAVPANSDGRCASAMCVTNDTPKPTNQA